MSKKRSSSLKLQMMPGTNLSRYANNYWLDQMRSSSNATFRLASTKHLTLRHSRHRWQTGTRPPWGHGCRELCATGSRCLACKKPNFLIMWQKRPIPPSSERWNRRSASANRRRHPQIPCITCFTIVIVCIINVRRRSTVVVIKSRCVDPHQLKPAENFTRRRLRYE